jgi:hypothetical protein
LRCSTSKRDRLTSQAFPFLDLPREIRLMVYDYIPIETRQVAMVFDNLVDLYGDSDGGLGETEAEVSRIKIVHHAIPLEILMTCREVHDEARTMMYDKVEKLNWMYAPSIIVPSYRTINDFGDVNISDNEVNLLGEIREAVTSNFPNDFAHIPLSAESLKVVEQYVHGVQLKWPYTDDYVHTVCLGVCADEEDTWPYLKDVMRRCLYMAGATRSWMAGRPCKAVVVPASRYLPSNRNWTRLWDWLMMQQKLDRFAMVWAHSGTAWVESAMVPREEYSDGWAEGWQFKRLSEWVWDLKQRQMGQ